MLARFEQISVRDENSRAIIQAALGFRPDLVLDPCLQFPPELVGTEHKGPPYLLIYGHNFSQWFAREVRSWAQAKGYLLVSTGYRNDWADMQWLTAGPEDFAKAMTHAQAVATNFFHGCVFSLINHKPFASELTPYRYYKLSGLMAAAFVGYVAEEEFRAWGSSGGMVSWVASELLREGLVDGVAHVVAAQDPQSEGRFFRYRISRTDADVRAGAKSRYYPVELSDVLAEIRSTPGRYAVVGVPCFIKAIHLLRARDPLLQERVAFTLGLFCGHMKSARLVESFAWQLGVPVDEVTRVEYRLKNAERPANWYTAHLTLRNGHTAWKDWWHLADGDWGAGFFQNSACNFCDDVVAETADISFGDAWAEPYSADGRGTNVVIVRSPQLLELIQRANEAGRLQLDPVGSEVVIQTQAAGLRQRREGLAYRLAWRRRGIHPRKRVQPNARDLPWRRKLIYRMRSQITAWSHHVFWLARTLRRPGVYLHWAQASLAVYHGLAYSRGRLGRLLDRIGLH